MSAMLAVQPARDLSPAEARVLSMFAAGRTRSKDIAEVLGCSPRTVDEHLSAIYAKTGARGRAALMWWLAEQRVGAQ